MVGNGMKCPNIANIWPKSTKNAKMAVFGLKVLIRLGGSKS